MQKWIKRMAILGIILVIVYGTACIWVYRNQEKLLFYPDPLPANWQYTDWPSHMQEVRLATPDGYELSVLHSQQLQPKGVIVYFHGNAGNLVSWQQIALNWHTRGYDVIMPDYRGYGSSTGSITNQATLLDDAELVYTYAQAHYPIKDIVVLGRSLGSGLAIWVASKNAPRQVILETPYTSIRDLAKRQMPFIPIALLKYPLQANEWISTIDCPIALIHGTNDELIPYQSSITLNTLAPERTTLYLIKGAGHNTLDKFSAYEQAISEITASQPNIKN